MRHGRGLGPWIESVALPEYGQALPKGSKRVLGACSTEQPPSSLVRSTQAIYGTCTEEINDFP